MSKEYCDRCDGCGWYEGGKTIQTHCEKCNGTGVVQAGSCPDELRGCGVASERLTKSPPINREPNDNPASGTEQKRTELPCPKCGAEKSCEDFISKKYRAQYWACFSKDLNGKFHQSLECKHAVVKLRLTALTKRAQFALTELYAICRSPNDIYDPDAFHEGIPLADVSCIRAAIVSLQIVAEPQPVSTPEGTEGA